jgi:7-cyano-7-deazaguanine synthase in queuosine biosynthesis
MSEIVLLNSGGIDSRVSAAMLFDIGWDVHSLFLDWNPASLPGMANAALATADSYCASHTVFKYPADFTVWLPPLRKRTMSFASLATTIIGIQFAYSEKISYVANGSRRECNRDREWVQKLSDIVNGNAFIEDGINLIFPVLNMNNDEVTARGRELGVDLESTWSCPNDPPCGQCESCVRRQEQGL